MGAALRQGGDHPSYYEERNGHQGGYLPPSGLRGAQGRNRTSDTVIFSHVLYQLSYLGIGTSGGRF